MAVVRRVLLLALLSVSGIALLAPLAARSAITPPAAAVDALLPAPAQPAVEVDRGFLSARTGAAGATVFPGREALEETAMPTPASAPMEATLYSAATPKAAAAPAPRPAVTYDGDTVWDALARCESGGNWASNTGNGYYGGLQFSLGTWESYGGAEFAAYPHQATREEQIVVAERLRAARGYTPWPACRAKLGLP